MVILSHLDYTTISDLTWRVTWLCFFALSLLYFQYDLHFCSCLWNNSKPFSAIFHYSSGLFSRFWVPSVKTPTFLTVEISDIYGFPYSLNAEQSWLSLLFTATLVHTVWVQFSLLESRLYIRLSQKTSHCKGRQTPLERDLYHKRPLQVIIA